MSLEKLTDIFEQTASSTTNGKTSSGEIKIPHLLNGKSRTLQVDLKPQVQLMRLPQIKITENS